MANLPTEYQEVEYIESSGTQRIDTGIRPDDTTYGLVCKINLTSISGDWTVANLGGPDINYYRYGINGLRDMWQPANIMTYAPSESYITGATTGTDYEVSFNYNSDRSLIVNGSTLKSGLATGSYTYGVNWNIFTWAYGNGSYGRYGSFKLYSFQIYKGTTLLRDFVPCYRKNDSVIGLYDLVGGLFYTNQGTGTFTKGLDVIKPLINHGFIGTWHKELGWKPGANTVAYFPLEKDINDYSGNNRVLSANGTITYSNIGGSTINVADFTSGQYLYSTNQTGLPSGNSDRYVGCWFRAPSIISGYPTIISFGQEVSNQMYILGTNNARVLLQIVGTGIWSSYPGTDLYANTWYYLAVKNIGNTGYVYINGVLKNSGSLSFNTTGSNIGICANRNGNSAYPCYLSQVIIESKARTDQEISDYYNLTKGNYGIN